MNQPIHPGQILDALLIKGLGLSQRQVAEELGISRQFLHGLVHGKNGVSPEMAVRLERYSGLPAEKWLELQAGMDLQSARNALVHGQVELSAIAGELPVWLIENLSIDRARSVAAALRDELEVRFGRKSAAEAQRQSSRVSGAGAELGLPAALEAG